MRFTKNSFHLIILFALSCIVVFTDYCYGARESDPLDELIRSKWRVGGTLKFDTSAEGYSSTTPVYVNPHQDGLKEADKINILPGQPEVKFDQYSGYVTVDPKAGRALFYYFVEASEEPSSKPLVLWLNGGPGCSSFGNGAMMELGPFRVNKDGQSLYENEHAWNKVANVIFLESPAGVGFSYSNTTSDYEKSGDIRTAQDSYTFMVNWLERFPQYKTRNFYIAGESYAGHYVPQLAQTILQRNKFSNQTLIINLRGIAIGNAWIDDETGLKGMYDYFWTHALISDKTIAGIRKHCNFSSMTKIPNACENYIYEADVSIGSINIYNIYAPFCINSSKKLLEVFDPCTRKYVVEYLNLPQVQKALHANVTALSYPWSSCSDFISGLQWNDSPETIIPTIQELMASGIGVWIYSGDIDGRVPVTSSQYAIDKLTTSVETPWYPWYSEGEVGGYVEGYKNLTFVTIREAGHFVPSYQPARALSFFSYFLEGKLPPTSPW